MPSQTYPPAYGTLPPYYSQSTSAGYPSSANSLATDSSYLAYPDPQQPTPAAMIPVPSSRPGFITDTQTEGGIFSGGYSSTAISSPCSSTHSEAAATTQIENTFKEFVTSVDMTTSPAVSCVSPNATNQRSPSLRTQQSMEVDYLSAEEGALVIRGQSGDTGELADTEEDGLDDQNMTERCVHCILYMVC